MTQTQKQNVPKLRFPEFDAVWTKANVNLNNIQIIDGDRGANYPKSDDFSSQGDCLFLSAKNVTKTGFVFDETSFISASKDAAMSKGKLSRGDIVLTTRGSLGHVALFSDAVEYNHIRINSGMVLLRTDAQSEPPFIYQQLISRRFQREVERISFGSAQPQLTVKGIKKMPVSICSLPEQRKIASFLGAVDEKITHLSRKKALLEDYKKGCMQQLFSQEIRFKDDDGNDFPDWEEKRLGGLAKITTGSSNREDSDSVGEYAFFDRSNDIRWSSRYLFDCEAIIVAGEGKDFPPRYFNGKFDLHQRAYAVTDFGVNSANFLFFWINQHRAHFLKFSVGSTMPSLRMNAFSNFPVSLPHPAEQRKIADFLSALDRKIDLVVQELTHARSFKAGLLQQMFV